MTKYIKYTGEGEREIVENEVLLIPELLRSTGLSDE